MTRSADQYEPSFVAETLAWCNDRRVEQGRRPLKKLPRGVRRDGLSCPCGKATGLFVGYRMFRTTPDNLAKSLPPGVVAFVRAFDYGELPQYEARRT